MHVDSLILPLRRKRTCPVGSRRRLSAAKRHDSPAQRLQILIDGEHATLIHVYPRVNPAIEDHRDAGEVGKLGNDASVELGPFAGDDVEELCLALVTAWGVERQ